LLQLNLKAKRKMDISALYKCFTECGKVTTDSRNCPEGSMFIALKGETFNGNAYALQALEKVASMP
jgi:UDP-N-acetylmuramoyl-tripeptide--D-alanyl-D-alanine ligase